MNSKEIMSKALSQIITGKMELIDCILKDIMSSKNSENSNILSESKLIEVVGPNGSGKSHIFNRLSLSLFSNNVKHLRYIPKNFSFNQVKNIVELITDISDEEFYRHIRASRDFSTSSRYDFFYYLTETLNQRNLFKSCLLLIDNAELLDQYTLDFLQYLVQYAYDKNIIIVTFNTDELFPFSIKHKIKYLTANDIKAVLQEIYHLKDNSFDTEAEVLENITGGNVYILENVLETLLSEDIIQKFDLHKYIDRRFDVSTIYNEKISSLSKEQFDLLVWTYLLDQVSSEQDLKDISNSKVSSFNKDINALIDKGFISLCDKVYILRKVKLFEDYIKANQTHNISVYINRVIEYLKKINIEQFILCKYYLINKQYKEEFFKEVIVYLTQLCSNEALLEIYNFILENQEDMVLQVETIKNIGLINRKIKKLEVAAENFRKALRFSVNQKLPLEEIVYLLAQTLYDLNSNNFSQEILKTYSSDINDIYWKAKLALLKSEILAETEEFEEAMTYVEEAYQNAILIEDKHKRYYLHAETKKIKGKIFYYSNLWDKAEISFKEAESLYKVIEDYRGLAAIYNNIGVLKVFQGEYEQTEKLYLASLDLEQKSFNLEGIAICYNNLGGLADDQEDYKKSLYYYNEALKIQKFLSERYNISNCYNNIGVTYMDNGDYDKAAEAFKQSLDTAINFGLFKNIIAGLNNLGALYYKSGNWTKAIEYYEEAIKKSNECEFMEGLLRSYNNIGELYEKRGEYSLAHDLYFKGYEILPAINDEYLKAELYGNLGSVLTCLHKFGEAYGYLVESFDFFKNLNAKDKIIEGALKQANYFILTRNYESADYYLSYAYKLANELHHFFHIAMIKYYRAILERKNPEQAKKFLEEAIEYLKDSKHKFELSLVFYEYSSVLHQLGEWEQALNILNNNINIIKEFGAIKFLEQNDLLIQDITKKYAVELKESRFHESILNKYSDIISKLNQISDFDVILESALLNIVDFAEADGGVLCLYNSRALPDSWEYKIFKNYSSEEKDYDIMMELMMKSYNENTNHTYKQPHFAVKYNDICTFNLSLRNHTHGVLLLFSKHGTHYFAEKMINLISSLCNQVIMMIENIRYSNLSKSHAVLREELESSNQFTNIVGKSSKMTQIFELIDKIKDTPTSILVEGPSGTGKELIARAIHYNSNRRNKKFVAQYCGALPETLLESELFGHIKGSFTGATYDKKGLFEVADGGTFFLDEIADISLSTQAKLLRFLQEGEIKRVGSTKTEKVDVRVICATNVKLIDKVKKGEFRLDLYYRLNVIRIEVPSLKDRKSDIPLLGIHFLDKYNTKIKKKVHGITDEAMKYLQNYEWPGNIRQLENEIERAVTLAEPDSYIKPYDLSEEVYKFSDNTDAVTLYNNNLTLKEATEQLERKMIERAMIDCRWNQSQAAKILGISRQGLIKKLKRYEIEEK
ncbi:MAG: sigma 54-interacting transcriptional regulator [Candidatus Cloacimonetes bacterium]|nr:sigma 54-interacting transcriptional regulator [Candidatus Cloacimonadota bacterium]